MQNVTMQMSERGLRRCWLVDHQQSITTEPLMIEHKLVSC